MIHIRLTTGKGQHTATATRCGDTIACATCKNKNQAIQQARDGAQQMLLESGLKAEPAIVVTAPPKAKMPAPVFSAGPSYTSELVQNLRTVTRLG